MNEFLIKIFQLIVLIFSVMVHEVSHGLAAYRLGDDTAKKMGRLNLNPLNHIDPFGSVFLPLFLALVNSPILVGWAKPVLYNPKNLKNPKSGAAWIGIAGPLSNLALAVIFGILTRVIAPFAGELAYPLVMFFNSVVFINILLAIFNLVPIPPLDGSKLLFAVLPYKYRRVQSFLEQYGMVILLFFIFFGFGFITPIIRGFYYLLVGRWAIL